MKKIGLGIGLLVLSYLFCMWSCNELLYTGIRIWQGVFATFAFIFGIGLTILGISEKLKL